ncbi:MAG: hypothetical protein ACREIK_00190 [Nitrospiraceae bacterium]
MRLLGLVGKPVGLIVGAAYLSACASMIPPSRMVEYVGPQAVNEPLSASPLPQSQIRAGLVLVSDTTAPDAAPALPDEALTRLAESLQQQINEYLPSLKIERIIPAEGIRPGGDISQFSELGKKHGLDYVAAVVASSTEQEYPMTLFLGWVSHSQPGLRRDNWSLMEVALVDVKSGRSLLRAEGRGWATLDRPTAPGINQWYPVIWRRPQDPNWRWWPKTYAGAPNTLRVIAMNEAAKRLLMHLQDAWIQKRRAELTAASG